MFVDETAVEVTMLRADGSSFALDTSLPDAAPDAELDLVFDVTADLIFVAVYDDLPGLDHNLAHYRVYERDTGALVWDYADVMWEPQGRAPYLGEDGRVALFVYSSLDNSDISYSQVLGPDGPIDLFEGVARSPVGPDDWLAIEVGESFPRWRNVTSKNQTSPSHPQYNEYSSWVGGDGTLAHLAEIDDAIYFVTERVDEPELIPWPELEPYLLNGWSLSRANFYSRQMEVANGDDERLLRLLDGDVSEEWELFPPPGHFEPKCTSSRLSFDAEDQMIMTWRDADGARLFVRATPDDDWSPLPDMLPIAEVHGSSLGTGFGTYYLRGYAPGEKSCFAPGDWANPPPETMLGSSLQILRPVDETHIQSDYGAFPSIVAEGRCSARPLSDDPAQPWRIDDLVNQTWIAAPLPGRLLWLPS